MRDVLLLEDDTDLCAIMRELLLTLGARRCTVVHSVQELTELSDDVLLGMNLALLDVNLGTGEPSGVDAYHWLRERGFKGEIVFLTGHAQSHPLIQQALALPNVTVLSKPASPAKLAALVES